MAINNAKLKNLFRLSHKVTFYVPSTVDVDKAVDNTAQVERVAAALSSWFGGATSTPALGYWLSPAAGLVAEKTVVVFAYAAESDLEAHVGDVVELAESIKAEMKQEAVAVEIDGEMYFI